MSDENWGAWEPVKADVKSDSGSWGDWQPVTALSDNEDQVSRNSSKIPAPPAAPSTDYFGSEGAAPGIDVPATGFAKDVQDTGRAAGAAALAHPQSVIPGTFEALAAGAGGMVNAADVGISGLARGASEALPGGIGFQAGFNKGAAQAESDNAPLMKLLEPETDFGKAALNVLGLLPGAAYAAGGQVAEDTGSPALGAAVTALGNAAMFLEPFRALKDKPASSAADVGFEARNSPKIAKPLEDVSTPFEDRKKAVNGVWARMLQTGDVEGATNWVRNAAEDIRDGKPIDLSKNGMEPRERGRVGNEMEGEVSSPEPLRLTGPEQTAGDIAAAEPRPEPPRAPEAVGAVDPLTLEPVPRSEPVAPEAAPANAVETRTAGNIEIDPANPRASIAAIAAAPITPVAPAVTSPAHIDETTHAAAAGDVAGIMLAIDHLTRQAKVTPPAQRQPILEQIESLRQEARQSISDYGNTYGAEAGNHMHGVAAETFHTMKGDYQSLVRPPEVNNALQEPSAGSVLQRQPSEAGGAGSERGRVEQGVQGSEAARAQGVSEFGPATPNAEQVGALNAKGEIAPIPGTIAPQTKAQESLPATKQNIVAGNAALDHRKLGPFDISIENKAGSTRSDLKNIPPKWQTTMQADYGYAKRTTGNDGDHLDFFVKKGTPDNYSGPMFVVDQVNAKGAFDEHKVMGGYPTIEAAKAAYLAHYPKGWTGLGNISQVSMDGLKFWARHGDMKAPYAERKLTDEEHKINLDSSQKLMTVGTRASTRAGVSEIRGLEHLVLDEPPREFLGDEWGQGRAARKLTVREHSVIAGLIKDLVGAGVDKKMFEGLASFHVYTGETLHDNMSHMMQGQTAGIGISENFMSRLLAGDKSYEVAALPIMIHELTHHLDFQKNRLVGFTKASDGAALKYKTGSVYKEAADYELNNTDSQLGDFLAYPMHLDGDLKPADMQEELFAQLNALFHTQRDILRSELPLAYALMEKVNAAAKSATGIADARSAVREAVRTFSGNEGESGAVVRGRGAGGDLRDQVGAGERRPAHRVGDVAARPPEAVGRGVGEGQPANRQLSNDRTPVVREAKNPAIAYSTGSPPAFKGRVTIDTIGKHLDSLVKGPLDMQDPKNVERATQMARQEFDHQLKQARSGLNWYDEDIKTAHELTSKYIPELTHGSGEDSVLGAASAEVHRQAFSIVAAIHSPSTDARANWLNAGLAYKAFTETGKLPEINPETQARWGPHINPLPSAYVNSMVEDMGLEKALAWILTTHTVKELNDKKHSYGIYKNAPVSGKMADIKLGAHIFGPKVGPFALGLNGFSTEVAVDSWATRTTGRWFGNIRKGGDNQDINDAPNEEQRRAFTNIATVVAKETGYNPNQVQAVLWFFEQHLYSAMGLDSESRHFSDGAKDLLKRVGIEHDTGTATETGADGRHIARHAQEAGLAGETTVNIGLDTNDGRGVSQSEAVRVLEQHGVTVTRQSRVQSDTEPTLVATLSRALTPKEAHAVAVALRQEAIAQKVGKAGELYGPGAEAWRPFQDQYFKSHPTPSEERRLSQHVAKVDELTDLPKSSPGALPAARDAAERYMKKAGMDYTPPTNFVQVDPAMGKRIADAYAAMKHDPENPAVKSAYRAMIRETVAQWHAVAKTGLQFKFTDAEHPYPYKVPSEVFADVRDNNTMWVYSTHDDSFGGNEAKGLDVSDNPLLAPTGIMVRGKNLLANDVFRAVHDYFGHIKDGVGFLANGEENAWRSHASMFSPEARKAMTSETRGQNSWVNWGPFGEKNRSASQTETEYAAQKTGLLPDWVVEDNHALTTAAPERKIANMKGDVSGPIWYSKLERAVAEKAPFGKNGMPAKQLQAWLTARSKDGLVKDTEIKWSGLGDWLQMQDGNVTRDEIKQFLDQNGVKVTETELSNSIRVERYVIEVAKGVFEIHDENNVNVGGDTFSTASRAHDHIKDMGSDNTQYSAHQLPGGKNYRELLLTLPYEKRGIGELRDGESLTDAVERAQTSNPVFKSSHFSQPNILAHVRFNERTDANGKKVLFIEELQSDWAQKGRKEGFSGAGSTAQAKIAELNAQDAVLTDKLHNGNPTKEEARELEGRILVIARKRAELQQQQRDVGDTVPNAPFVGKTEAWIALALKRMIRYAADNGFDRVAWTTGEQQADRYDLSKSLSRVVAERNKQGQYNIYAYDKDGNEALHRQNYPAEQLPDFVGKDLAEKIVNDITSPGGKTYSGLDLRVGGEGMKSFYDQIVPNVANDVLKELGGGRVDYGDMRGAPDKFGARTSPTGLQNAGHQPGFDITDKMIENATSGQPLFSKTSYHHGAVERKISLSRHDFGTLTPEQEQALKNTGGIVDGATLAQRYQKARANIGMKLKQGIVDQFAPLKNLDEHAYILSRLSKASDGALEAMMVYGNLSLLDGVTDARAGQLGVIDSLQKLQGEHHRFMWWVAAHRAEQLTADEREHLFSKTDIAALKSLNLGNMKDGSSRQAAYTTALGEYNRFSRNILDIAEQSGIIDGESRAMWEKEFYVPFYRAIEAGVSTANIKQGGGLVRQYAFKTLKGGTEKLHQDLLANVLMNWSHLLSASAKNRAARASLIAAENAGVAAEEPGWGVSGSPIPKDAVWYLENGRKSYYSVSDPFVLDAITSLESGVVGGIAGEILSKVKNVLTMGVTANPAFKIRNLIRDSIASIAQSELSYNVPGNVLKGVVHMAQKGRPYASMLAGGGLIRFGSMLEGNRSHHVDKLVKAGVDANTILDSREKMLGMLTVAWDHYNELGDISEGANRISLYEQMRAAGKTHEQAIYAARDLLDFSMGGSWAAVRFLTQTVPFMNARVQGLYKLGKAGRENPARMGAVIGAVALASIALMLAHQDDEDWKKREDWDRDNYWWFKVGGVAFRIPKPFEVGAIATLAERSVETWVSDEMTAKRFWQRVQYAITQTFSMNPVPQLAKPMLDVYANTNSFTGNPIEGQGMEKLPKGERETPQTSEFAKAFAPAANAALSPTGAPGLSPVQIDYLVKGYFGWLGTMALATSDAAVRPLTDHPERASAQLKDVFLVGNFAETLPADQSRYVTKFYDQAKVIKEAYASYRAKVAVGDKTGAAEYKAEHPAEIKAEPKTMAFQTQLSEINAAIRKIEASRSLDADAKRTRLSIQYARRNAIAEKAARVTELQ